MDIPNPFSQICPKCGSAMIESDVELKDGDDFCDICGSNLF